MAQIPGHRTPRTRPGNDIYTVLAGMALLAVAGTIGFVIYQTTELLGTPFPGF